MDPLTIVGLAASIVQLVDIGHKLVTGAKEVYDSTNGLLTSLEDMKLIADDIQNAATEIKGSPSFSKNERDVVNVAQRSLDLANELQQKLKRLEIRPDRSRKVEAARVVLQSMWQRKDIKELDERLSKIYGLLQGRMAAITRGSQHSNLVSYLKIMQNRNDELQIATTAKLDQVLGDLQATFAIRHESLEEQVVPLKEVSEKLLSILQKARETEENQDVIKSLYFSSLKQRRQKIPPAYRKTLEWLYDPSRTDLSTWLCNDSGVYWINGQAGSGKSTLMNFACDHPQTLRALSSWAGARKVVTANYFFWNSGKPMQRSQQGLLQSILCQILRSEPELISKIGLRRTAQEPWSISELRDVFHEIEHVTLTSTKLCFFIDGLDEYDGPEEEILAVLQKLTQSPHVKICASSRPWPAFEHALKKSGHVLIVQEFTKSDMREYVRGMLEESPAFQELKMNHPERSQNLVSEIVTRAKGVWLWVYLVVRDLSRDVTNQEDFDFLEKRLDAIPDQLEKYFAEIMGRIEMIYKPEMAEIFLTAVASVRPLPLYAFSFLSGVERKDLGSVTDSELRLKSDALRIKVKTRCRDLLTIQFEPDEKFFFRLSVDFLHRTVRDFLRKNYQITLHQEAPPGFDERAALCSMMVGLLRSYPTRGFQQGNFNHLIGIVDEFLYYAYDLELFDLAEAQFELLDEIDAVMSAFALRAKVGGHWTQVRDAPRPTKYQKFYDHHPSFLCLVVQSRLRHYADHILAKEPHKIRKLGRPLLDYALRPRRITPITLPYHADREITSIDVDLISTLLVKGADPNEKIRIYDQLTPMACFALSCFENKDNETVSTCDREAWFSATKLLVKYGGHLDGFVTIEIPNTTTPVHSPQLQESRPRPAVLKTRYNRPMIVDRVPTKHFEPANVGPVQKRVSVEETFAMVFSNPQMQILRAEKSDFDGKQKNQQWSWWSLVGF